MFADEHHVMTSLEAGATGYLLKDASVERIAATLQHGAYDVAGLRDHRRAGRVHHHSTRADRLQRRVEQHLLDARLDRAAVQPRDVQNGVHQLFHRFEGAPQPVGQFALDEDVAGSGPACGGRPARPGPAMTCATATAT